MTEPDPPPVPEPPEPFIYGSTIQSVNGQIIVIEPNGSERGVEGDQNFMDTAIKIAVLLKLL